jgi:hypothetical protein
VPILDSHPTGQAGLVSDVAPRRQRRSDVGDPVDTRTCTALLDPPGTAHPSGPDAMAEMPVTRVIGGGTTPMGSRP